MSRGFCFLLVCAATVALLSGEPLENGLALGVALSVLLVPLDALASTGPLVLRLSLACLFFLLAPIFCQFLHDHSGGMMGHSVAGRAQVPIAGFIAWPLSHAVCSLVYGANPRR